MPSRNVLFICSKNRRRSLTAKNIFADHPDIEVMSAGLNRDPDTPLTPDLLRWADTMFVMEPSHRARLSMNFREHLDQQRIINLAIPDRYEPMDPQLIAELQAKVPKHL